MPLALSDYDLSPERGFLSSFDPDQVELPELLHPVRDAAQSLPVTIVAGKVRTHIEAIPHIDLTDFCATAPLAQQRIAMVHYSFLVQTYVWGEPDAPKSLPANIAEPIWRIGRSIGQPPLLPYSSYVLDNWAKIDPDGPIDLSNLYMIQPFLAGQDEVWFVLVHVAIEAEAGQILAAIPDVMAAVEQGDTITIKDGLSQMIAAWDRINAIFDRMPERCDPYVYFHRVRPWIHGWKNNPALGDGLIYEGVAETGGKPQAFCGQTGSQSSIVPAFDAFMGIEHAGDALRTFLDELHIYRPPLHRQFIDDVRSESSLRGYVLDSDDAELKELYNTNVLKLARFRTRHLEYAASYINKQSKDSAGNDSDVGTGGTPFMKYLKKHRDEAESHVI